MPSIGPPGKHEPPGFDAPWTTMPPQSPGAGLVAMPSPLVSPPYLSSFSEVKVAPVAVRLPHASTGIFLSTTPGATVRLPRTVRLPPTYGRVGFGARLAPLLTVIEDSTMPLTRLP